MTQVLLVRREKGDLQSCSAKGHAGFAVKGNDIVCAAVTTLLTTTLSVLENIKDIRLTTKAASRGKLAFKVKQTKSITNDSVKELIFAGKFLETGLKRLARDYPENVMLQVQIID